MKTMKTGDRVYCINDLISLGNVYCMRGVYYIIDYISSHDYYGDYGDGYYVDYYLHINGMVYCFYDINYHNFSDYFIDLAGSRKLKLERLASKCIEMKK